jgi:hypothetical protein
MATGGEDGAEVWVPPRSMTASCADPRSSAAPPMAWRSDVAERPATSQPPSAMPRSIAGTSRRASLPSHRRQ